MAPRRLCGTRAATPPATPSGPAPRPDALLGAPALPAGEDLAALEAAGHELADGIVPEDAIEWLWVRAMTDLEWEGRRLRRTRATLVEEVGGTGRASRETLGVEDIQRQIAGVQARIQAGAPAP